MQACFIRNVVHFKKVGIGRHTNIVLTGKVLGQSMFFVNNHGRPWLRNHSRKSMDLYWNKATGLKQTRVKFYLA